MIATKNKGRLQPSEQYTDDSDQTSSEDDSDDYSNEWWTSPSKSASDSYMTSTHRFYIFITIRHSQVHIHQ